ncbi:putative DEAD box helicase [Tirmania nivea]|nr:putative DEAD box helicase [Tirmania nivea]
MPISRRSLGRVPSGIQNLESRQSSEGRSFPLTHCLRGRYERELPEPTSAWRMKPEIPTVQDLLCAEVDIPPNRVKGKWQSVEEYLGTHYELLREDAYSTLRDATLSVRMTPTMDDLTEICIYENVRIVGYTWSNHGVGVKCSFSLNRARKKIQWANSKRLIPGTLVCLSCDNFKEEKNMRLATVLARPVTSLELNPPEVDLLFADDQIEIDSHKPWLMVESRGSYFEAYKHTLKALQRMKPSNFPLHEHIVSIETEIPPPQYIQDEPVLNLSLAFPDIGDLTSVNVLGQWPKIKESIIDQNQLQALKRMITSQLAIVQGPPGTGKTYTSVLALKALISNMKQGDPPLVISCQTNHALDQLLRKIIEFEPEVIRLGGRTQDQDKIKGRTLYQKRNESTIKIKGSARGRAKAEMTRLEKSMMALLEPLKSDLLSAQTLHKLGIITDNQLNAFVKWRSDWVSAIDDSKPMGDMASWLEGFVDHVEDYQDTYKDLEEEEIDTEQLLEIEAEFHGANEESEFELKGQFMSVRKYFTVAEPVGVDERIIEEHLRSSKVWDWEGHVRAAVYKRWEALALEKVLVAFRQLNMRYAECVKEFKIARLEKDAYILGGAKVVGMTNTGLAKYRSLVASLCPRIVMIEEAAESLEGPIITACFPTIQHMILVGDHQQLRPHCNSRELEKPPFNLGISMFERLVDNGIGFDRLKVQWRMRPEIRQLLSPIYHDLEDNEEVMNRPHIPGMGTVDVFFYWHNHHESMDDGTSRLNMLEAEMIVNFTLYLQFNGVEHKDITILTFYGGQKNLISKLIRREPELRPFANQIKVATVDSYQGEENEVVLLSLVRSNESNNIGFLTVKNRVCVAMSRARSGFYIFGNGRMITNKDELWWEIGKILNSAWPKKIGYSIPLTCQKHNRKVEIKDISEWMDIKGGCNEICGKIKKCSHVCRLKCHPFKHKQVRCYEECIEKLPCCGQPCPLQCHEPCMCKKCKAPQKRLQSDLLPDSGPSSVPVLSVGAEVTKVTEDIRRDEAGTPIRTKTTYMHTFRGDTELVTEEVKITEVEGVAPGTTAAVSSVQEIQSSLEGLIIEESLIDFDGIPGPPPVATTVAKNWEWDA